MSKDQLLALAAKCEVAQGPDREIDTAIALALGIRPDFKADWGSRGNERTTYPAFTASLDAAMTLADDYGGEVTFFKDGTAKAFLWQPYPMAVEAKAATPALALCAASLRARANG